MIRFDRFLWPGIAICLAGLVSTTAMGDSSIQSNHRVVYKIGQVTRHARKFVNQGITLTGYLLAQEEGYAIVSDEPRGKISAHDLPVSGAGLDRMRPMKKYVFEGNFLDHGFKAINGSRYHLELVAAPQEASP
jgi:hypothetical protein